MALYKSLVLLHFDYCDNVYECTSNENLHKLQLVQNSACRTLLLADMDMHIEDMHRDLGLPTLQQRRVLHLGYLRHKNIFFNGCASLAHFYVPVLPVAGRVTRSVTKRSLVVPRRRSNVGKKGISVRGPIFSNSLPDDLSVVENFNSFKRQLKLRIVEIAQNHPT